MHQLGVMLAIATDGKILSQVSSMSRETLERGGRVFLYLIDEGVTAVALEEIQRLRREGVQLFCCAYGARKRRIPWDNKATFGGLAVLADLLSSCDSFVAFTPLGVSTSRENTPKRVSNPLIVVSTDPSTSHLPAEAVRIAAGLQPWLETRVDLLLEGPAAKILLPETSEIMDEKFVSDNLKAIRKWNHPIHLGFPVMLAEEFYRSDKHFKKLTAKEVRILKSHARNVFYF